MTDREKAIVMAYTGVTMLSGEKFSIFHEYIEEILGRPVWTHELAIDLVWNEIKEKSKADFLEICNTEEKPQCEWLDYSGDFYKCPECGYLLNKLCPQCHNKVILPKGNAEMRGDDDHA